jgi:hypothetical protein
VGYECLPIHGRISTALMAKKENSSISESIEAPVCQSAFSKNLIHCALCFSLGCRACQAPREWRTTGNSGLPDATRSMRQGAWFDSRYTCTSRRHVFLQEERVNSSELDTDDHLVATRLQGRPTVVRCYQAYCFVSWRVGCLRPPTAPPPPKPAPG